MAPKAQLLLVEDEADMAFLIAANLRNEGYEVRVAKNGLAGLNLARKHKPDLILSDVMLPKMDGHEMIRLLRQESNVPVLFLTGKHDEADRVRVQLDGDGYMTKPFSMSALVCRVRAMLAAPGEKQSTDPDAHGRRIIKKN